MIKLFGFFIISLVMVTTAQKVVAQKVDTLFFNLYTDSLKKGTYNYINVDGKFSDGRFLPLTEKELCFTTTAGKFKGNSLFIDTAFKESKVVVKAALKSNPSIFKEITIYIKQVESMERLRTVEEILNTPGKKSSRDKKNKFS